MLRPIIVYQFLVWFIMWSQFIPAMYSAFGSVMGSHISCSMLPPEEKKSLRIFVLLSIVATICEFGHTLLNFAPANQVSLACIQIISCTKLLPFNCREWKKSLMPGPVWKFVE